MFLFCTFTIMQIIQQTYIIRNITRARVVLQCSTGLIISEGQLWKEQRRFALSTLRDFGMGKSALQSEIIGEMDVLTQHIDAMAGQPFDIHYLLTTSICNLIFSIVFGKRFSHNDPVLTNHLKHFGVIVENSTILTLVISRLPFLRYCPGDPLQYHTTMESVRYTQGAIAAEIEEHKATYKPGVTRDYVDCYLHRMKENNNPDNVFEGETSFTGTSSFHQGDFVKHSYFCVTT